MNTLTPVELLQSFPLMLYIWSILTLIWGVGIIAVLYQLSKRVELCRSNAMRNSDRYVLALVALVNVFLLWYLIEYNSTSECTSWIAVVNVFYTAHLTCISIDVTRWWNSIKRCHSNLHLT